jgi:glycosyltransferase involved in cell wall biosynthesis
MKIGVTTFGADGGFSGISQYVRNVLREFSIIGGQHRFEVLVFEDERNFFVPEADNFSSHIVSRKFQSPVTNILWHQTVLPRLCRQKALDVLYLPAGNRRLPLSVPCPTVGTVHDFSSLHVNGKYDPARDFYIKKVLPSLIRRLDRVLTVSESSKRDIIEFGNVAEDKVLVTPLAAEKARYYPSNALEARRQVKLKFGILGPYMLYISRIEHPGNNHVRLIKAFEIFKKRTGLPHQLVLAGSDRERAEEVHRAAEHSEFSKEIVFTGFAADEDLPDLYRASELFMFPSLYEGFGLPVLEAMACGVPVACSDLSSLPEVCGDAGLLFNPYKETSIAEAIIRLLESEQVRERYSELGLVRAGQFDWRATALQTLAALEGIGGP